MLIVGDIHYPHRIKEFPKYLTEFKNKVDVVVGTGDYTSYQSLLNLATLGKTFIGVIGNSDVNINLPDMVLFFYKGISFFLYHGHNIYPRGDIEKLYEIAEKFLPEIIIHGHTHKLDVRKYKDIIFINPGSATGSWGGSTPGEKKTALLLEIKDDVIEINSIGEVSKSWTFTIH